MSRLMNFLFPARPYGAAESWLLLATRIIFGLLLMSHGVMKWQSFETLASVFPDPIGVGSRAALMLAIFAEVICAAGFIVGAFYRLALIPMIATMSVVVFIVHASEPFAAKELGLVYLCVFVLMFFIGPGEYALDRLVVMRLNRGK